MDEADVLRRVRSVGEVHATTRVIALYAIGSLGHGGFSPASDVDLALVLADPPDRRDGELASVLRDELRDLPMPVSVFWDGLSSLQNAIYRGRFPACDRWDMCESGRLLVGTDVRHLVPRPSLRELLTCATDLALQMLSCPADVPGGTIDATALIRDSRGFAARGARDASKIVLLPIRFLYTLRTGTIGRIHEAVEYFLRAEADTPRRRLVEIAIAWRTARTADPEQTAALWRAALVPIYLEFIDAYGARMQADGDWIRVTRLLEWRERLTA
jgi:hypothetical protein